MQLVLTSLDTVASVEALREAQRTFNAAGFVIVPKEPTKDMLEAAGWDVAADIYRAMLAAAPKLV